MGRQIGTVDCQGTGDQGRCALVTLRGQHNEGVQVISAYRVCQKGAAAGPHTAYVYQIHDMIKNGDTTLDSRKIFEDMETLIHEKRINAMDQS